MMRNGRSLPAIDFITDVIYVVKSGGSAGWDDYRYDYKKGCYVSHLVFTLRQRVIRRLMKHFENIME